MNEKPPLTLGSLAFARAGAGTNRPIRLENLTSFWKTCRASGLRRREVIVATLLALLLRRRESLVVLSVVQYSSVEKTTNPQS